MMKRPILGAFKTKENDKHMLGPVQKLDFPMRHFSPGEEVDVVIVGVGSAGGVLLQRLARAGFRVVGIEAGPFWDTERDWVSDEAGSSKLYWNDLRITGGTDPITLGANNSGHRNATSLLNELAAVKTAEELEAIKLCEAVACKGFQAAREVIRAGCTEDEVVAASYATLLRAGYSVPGAQHVIPHVHVMAGPRSALAYRAFNLTSHATIQQGDTVVVQMDIGVNGYWAELTRTFFVGTISDEWRKAHQECIAAQDAALQLIHDGVKARDVDHAARSVMQRAGFGDYFKHGLGHGFGFQAINHAAKPVLHPASQDVLHSGMVHNMEPAVYIDGQGGIRLNDNIVVTSDGYELLSSQLPRDLDWLVV